MKKLLCILLCILLLSGCAATYDGPTQSKYALTEYSVSHYSFLGEVYTTRDVYAYDVYGNRVRTMAYRDGKLETVTNLRYDDAGNEISRTTWDHSGWIPMFDSRMTQTFDDQGRILSYASYNFWGRETGRSTYTYDDEERTRTWKNDSGDSQITWFDENGNDIRQVAGEYETVYQYDEQGNRIGWISYHNGALFDSYEARYDDRGRQIWGGRYNPQGELESQTSWEIDDEAHTITTHRADGWIRIEYFDPDGRLLRIEDYDNEGELSMLQQYTYREIQVPADREE